MTDLRFTQNFLHSEALVEKIVALAGLDVGDTVLEIGPGKGIITQALATQVGAEGRVVAVELDPALASALNQRFSDTPQIQIVQGDILTLDTINSLGRYAVFANVPFNITSALIDLLFTQDHPPQHATLILQKETLIGDAHTGAGETFKSLLLAPRYTVQVVYEFSRADFSPQPGVDTALFRFERRAKALVSDKHYGLYRDFLAFVAKDRVGEGAWRKLFSKRQLKRFDTPSSALTFGRGLKSQSQTGMIEAFALLPGDPSRQGIVGGAMDALRQQQQHTDTINARGSHHRSKKRR